MKMLLLKSDIDPNMPQRKWDSHTWNWVILTHLWSKAAVGSDQTKFFIVSFFSLTMFHKVWLPFELTQYSVYGGRSRRYWAKLGACHDTTAARRPILPLLLRGAKHLPLWEIYEITRIASTFKSFKFPPETKLVSVFYTSLRTIYLSLDCANNKPAYPSFIFLEGAIISAATFVLRVKVCRESWDT